MHLNPVKFRIISGGKTESRKKIITNLLTKSIQVVASGSDQFSSRNLDITH